MQRWGLVKGQGGPEELSDAIGATQLPSLGMVEILSRKMVTCGMADEIMAGNREGNRAKSSQTSCVIRRCFHGVLSRNLGHAALPTLLESV